MVNLARVCVDYRGVNKDTMMDKYPIPHIDELTDMVGRNKTKIFTSLDLMYGYHLPKWMPLCAILDFFNFAECRLG